MNTRQTARRYYLLALILLVVGLVISGCNSAAVATPPDPASFLLANGFTKDTADEATCSFPSNPCKAYINNIDQLTVLVYADGRIIIHIKEDQAQINEQSNLLQKVLTFLYPPDLVSTVMKLFTTSPSGEILARKGDGLVGNYYWAVDDFGFPNESIDIAVMPKTPVFKSSKDPIEVLQNAGFVRDSSDDMSASGNINASKAYINSDLMVVAILADDGTIGIGIIRDPKANFYFLLKQVAFEKGLITALYPAEISSQILSTIDTTGTIVGSRETTKGNLTWAIMPNSHCGFSVCPSNSGDIMLWVYPSP